MSSLNIGGYSEFSACSAGFGSSPIPGFNVGFNPNGLHVIQSLKQLRYCIKHIDVDEHYFKEIKELLPFGVDALQVLTEIGCDSFYLKQLRRTKKLKRILK